MGRSPTRGNENQRPRPRASGDPSSVQSIPAFAGMTYAARFSGELPWVFGSPDRMKVAVILSAAKDLQFRSGGLMQILRCAQNDRLSGEP